MTLADDLISVARDARGIAGELGFRVTTVERITRYKTSNIRKVASEEVVLIAEGANLDQPPRVRTLKEEEIAVGALAHGSVEIGAITPSEELDAWLRGEGLAAGDERFIRLTGPRNPKGDLYSVKSYTADKPLRRMLTCEPVEQGFP